MAYCCSQCDFTSNFETAMIMHHQLHHENAEDDSPEILHTNTVRETKSKTSPRQQEQLDKSFSSFSLNKGTKLGGRTSSATRLFDKLRAKISRTRMLFSHPEETQDRTDNILVPSECTSKALNPHPLMCRSSPLYDVKESTRECFSCHLCSFDADRITVLDRHLLNDHKIGMENLLKLVMAKTKDGLSDEEPHPDMFGIRQPYYKPPNEIIENGEFVIETVTPKIKILKHAATNTDKHILDITSLSDLSKELGDIGNPTGSNDDLIQKMQTLSECMCKFANSSNTLKKLTKRLESKNSLREGQLEIYGLGLGDRESPADWDRPHSEKVNRSRNRYGDSDPSRSENTKFLDDSLYF